jgi:hypothetical protein
MTRQLNIRSDEAFETARRLSAHLGKSTTEVVVDALRDYSARTLAPSSKTTPEQAKADWIILHRLIEEANCDRPPGLSSDHGDLYDEDGLPI